MLVFNKKPKFQCLFFVSVRRNNQVLRSKIVIFFKTYSKTITHPGATSRKTEMHPGTMSNSKFYSEASTDKENLSTGDDVESTDVSPTTSEKSATTNRRRLPQTAGGCEKAANLRPSNRRWCHRTRAETDYIFRAWIFKMSCFDEYAISWCCDGKLFCWPLWHISLHCTSLYCIATHCFTLYFIVLHCDTLL